MQFDAEFLARFQAHAAGVSLADEQIAIAVYAGPEVSVPTAAQPARHGARRKGVALGRNKCPIKTLFQNPTARAHIATSSCDLVFGSIAEGTSFVEKLFALEWGSRRLGLKISRRTWGEVALRGWGSRSFVDSHPGKGALLS
jgi:hypothetical protein